MVFSSQHLQSAMDVGLDRSHRLAQRIGHLGVGQLLDVAQDDRFAIARRQAGHPSRKLVHLSPPQHVFLGPCPRVRLAAVELDQARTHAPHSVAHDVDRDTVQPGPLFQVAYALGRVRGQGAVGPHESVLRHVLGVVPVAGEREAQSVNAVLVVPHQTLEDTVGPLHQLPKPKHTACGCMGTMMPPGVYKMRSDGGPANGRFQLGLARPARGRSRL